MGRKTSNVWDYYSKISPGTSENPSNIERYLCNKCDQSFAKNATRLTDHLMKSHGELMFVPNTSNTPKQKGQISSRKRLAGDDLDDEIAEGENVNGNDDLFDLSAHKGSSVSVDPSAAGVNSSLASRDALHRLASVSVCSICDAMSQLKLSCHMKDISLVPGFSNILNINICGPAHTIKMHPLNGKKKKKATTHHVDHIPNGSVVVISAPPGASNAVWGGLASCRALKQGCVGVVTDGKCRDLQEVCRIGLRVFSRGTSVQGNSSINYVSSIGKEVLVGDCVVREGDVIRGDINGLVVIPADRASDVAVRAEIIEQQDRKIFDSVQNGLSLHASIQKHRVKGI